MVELGHRVVPYLYAALVAVAFACWARPATDAGYKVLFLAGFATLCGLWLIIRLIAVRLR